MLKVTHEPEPQPGTIRTLYSAPVPATSERAPVLDPVAAAEGYDIQGRIGQGGMGEVWRVKDRLLGRSLAMKVIRADVEIEPGDEERFADEAQVGAQLQHPGMVPVHDLGRLEDGRLYFTMKEVRGRSLKNVIREVHQASESGPWRPGPSGWTFRRLVDAFHRVCETVARVLEILARPDRI